MNSKPDTQIHATVGEQARNVVVGTEVTQYNVTVEALAGPAKATPETRTAYLNWLIDRHCYLNSRGTTRATNRQVQVELDEVYISLQARFKESHNESDRYPQQDGLVQPTDFPVAKQEVLQRQNHDGFNWQSDKVALTTPIDLDVAVARHDKLVILGAPGSGKTTLLRYLALQNARALTDCRDGRFPLLVRIADYAENGTWKEQSLSDFLPETLRRSECDPPGLVDLIQNELAQGGCLLLFDGLDEIIEVGDRLGVVESIQDFIRRYEKGGWRGKNHFVITSRIAGYRNELRIFTESNLLAHYVVQDMNDEQIGRFLERWCRAVEDSQSPDLSEDARLARAQREIDGIKDAISKSPSVRRLAVNPLMLRVLALIHRTQRRLPQKRIHLYQVATEILAQEWRMVPSASNSVFMSENYLTFLLSQLAYWMHEHKPTNRVTKSEIYEQLGAAFAKQKPIPDWDPGYPDPTVYDEIDKFLLIVREQTGLLVEFDPNSYGFMHLTFEEYYAARYIVARRTTRAELIRKHLHDPRWEEPILLALGFVGLDEPSEAAELVETVILAQGTDVTKERTALREHEELLGQNYLFVLKCWGTDVPINLLLQKQIIERFVNEVIYLTGLTKFYAYRSVLDEHFVYITDNMQAMELLEPHIINALSAQDHDVRDQAVALIRQIPNKPQRIVQKVLLSIREEKEIPRFFIMVEALEGAEYDNNEIILRLKNVLSEEDVFFKFYAAKLLVDFGHITDQVIDIFIAGLRNKTDLSAPFYAARSLFDTAKNSPNVVEKLHELLNDNDEMTRYFAALGLCELELKSPQITAVLTEAMYAEDRIIQSRASQELCKLIPDSPELFSIFQEAILHPDWHIRFNVACVLSELEDPFLPALPLLIKLLRDDSGKVWPIPIAALTKWSKSSDEVLQAVRKLLSDENPHAHCAAAFILLGQHIFFGLHEVSLQALQGIPEMVVDEDPFARSLVHVLLDEDTKLSPDEQKFLLKSLEDLLDEYEGDQQAYLALYLKRFNSNLIEVDQILFNALHSDNVSLRYEVADELSERNMLTDVEQWPLIDDLGNFCDYQTLNSAIRYVEKHGEVDNLLLDKLQQCFNYIDEDAKWRSDVRIREKCAEAFVRLARRTPEKRMMIINKLVETIEDPNYEVNDTAGHISKEYAYSALQILIANQKVRSNLPFPKYLLELDI